MLSENRPTHLYKYRAIDENNLENDHSLNALFNSFAVLSSRSVFNDPFDSKIINPRPTPLELKIIIEHFISASTHIRAFITQTKRICA